MRRGSSWSTQGAQGSASYCVWPFLWELGEAVDVGCGASRKMARASKGKSWASGPHHCLGQDKTSGSPGLWDGIFGRSFSLLLLEARDVWDQPLPSTGSQSNGGGGHPIHCGVRALRQLTWGFEELRDQVFRKLKTLGAVSSALSRKNSAGSRAWEDFPGPAGPCDARKPGNWVWFGGWEEAGGIIWGHISLRPDAFLEMRSYPETSWPASCSSQGPCLHACRL